MGSSSESPSPPAHRLASGYHEGFLAAKTAVELDDFSDYTSSITHSIAVPLSRRLSLKVGLKWLYNSGPALEDVDVVAEVVLLDSDGIPGSGDERYETVESGGVEFELGSVQERRRDRLDTIFTTSLAIEF